MYILSDFIINIIANFLPVFALQFLILPFLGKYDSSGYGVIILIQSIFTLISGSCGIAINNVRLIRGDTSSENYNFVLLLLSFVSSIVVLLISSYYTELNLDEKILIFIISIFLVVKEYLLVSFRLILDFKKVLYSNFFLTIGYGLGIFIFYLINQWLYIYLLGYLTCLVYILKNTKLWKEPFKIDFNTFKIGKETSILLLSALLLRVTTYADKIIIFPILGSHLVAVYYIATILGRISTLVFTPVSNVCLSYISSKNSQNKLSFFRVLYISGFISLLSYILFNFLGEYIFKILYPLFVESVLIYIPITLATMGVNSISSLLNPFILKYFKLRWQVIINTIYVCIYLIISLPLLKVGGLYGFCVGALITEIVKLLIIIFLYIIYDNRSKNLKSVK